MIANPISKKDGTLEKIEKREIDLSSYIEYKNQEYILTIKDLKFEVSTTPDIDVKVINKSDASPPGYQIFDGDNLNQQSPSPQISEKSKHKFL